MQWRRIAQIHSALGNRLKAREARLTAAAAAEDTTTRSLIADELLAAGEPEAAKQALGQLGYLGKNPVLLPLASRSQVAEAEKLRLEAPTLVQRGPNMGLQIFPTRLVMQLVVRGAREEAKRLLKPRLDFALQRGGQGGRTQSFHDAILCTFYLGDHAKALKATERESPYWRVQTLYCLLVGGMTDAEQILFSDMRQQERDYDLRLVALVPPSVQEEIVQRLQVAIPQIPRTRPEGPPTSIEHLEDPGLGRLAMLAATLERWDLARITVNQIQDPAYQQACLQDLEAKRAPLFAPVRLHKGTSNLGILSQNLSRISRHSNREHALRLLKQTVAEAQQLDLVYPMADYLAQTAWQYSAWELIPPLLTERTSDWFPCAQRLKLAGYFRTQGDLARARVHFEEAERAVKRIEKRNQRVLLSLDAAEEARLLGELAACDRLRTRAHEEALAIATSTIRNEVIFRLLRLDALRRDKVAFERSLKLSQSFIEDTRRLFPAEADRLRIELFSRLLDAGQNEESLRILQRVEAPSLQPHALCNFAERLLGLTVPKRAYPMESLVKRPPMRAQAALYRQR